MTHPHVLHAAAAAWSLRVAWPHLQCAAAAAQAAAVQVASEDGGSLRSALWGTRGRLGVHADRVATAALRGTGGHPVSDPYSRVMTAVHDTLTWLAGQVAAETTGDPMERLIAAIPALAPDYAGELTRWLTEADQQVRQVLQLLPEQWPLPGSPPCPACGVRLLRVQVAAPDTTQWTVVCTAGCRCTGEGCPCGMDVTAVGVGHIWAAGSPLVATTLARLPRRRVRPSRCARPLPSTAGQEGQRR